MQRCPQTVKLNLHFLTDWRNVQRLTKNATFLEIFTHLALSQAEFLVT
jgi:hypothetical protein